MSTYRHITTGEIREFDPAALASHPKAALWASYTAPIPSPVVPQSVTPLQMRKALRAAGLKSAVDAALATQSEGVREEWEFAIEVRRDNATLTAFAASLGQTSADLDALFQLAAAK
jgi:hypothetical protein